jgi:hypothetical protein
VQHEGDLDPPTLGLAHRPRPQGRRNRTWATKHRGPILIHAGKTLDPYFYQIRQDVLAQGVEFPDAKHIERGGIVGQANIVDCVTESSSEWFSGPYGFVLEDAQPLPFQPCKGQLGIFDLCESQ